MSNIYISIVSHYNCEDIINNTDLVKINKFDNTNIIIRDNISSEKLKQYCNKNGFYYNTSKTPLGFGANNNRNFNFASNIGMNKLDWFILINPDVNITSDMLLELYNSVLKSKNHLFAINLFSDQKLTVMEQSLRKYPSYLSFFNIIKGKSFTEAYNKKDLNDGFKVEWAAGSFLVFKTELYKKLNGFDESYFMYFEDVDICYRANKKLNEKVVYLKEIKAIHKGAYQNRNIFSPHFKWYVSSLLRFLFKRVFGGRA